MQGSSPGCAAPASPFLFMAASGSQPNPVPPRPAHTVPAPSCQAQPYAHPCRAPCPPQVDAKLRAIMHSIYRTCKEAAEEYHTTLAAGNDHLYAAPLPVLAVPGVHSLRGSCEEVAEGVLYTSTWPLGARPLASVCTRCTTALPRSNAAQPSQRSACYSARSQTTPVCSCHSCCRRQHKRIPAGRRGTAGAGRRLSPAA